MKPVTILLAAALAAAGCGRTSPNVIVIVMDTTRADRCSFGGYERPTTPRLDAFAKDAVVYLDAWSPSGWTAPAHAALFTGLRPDHVGLQAGDRLYLQDGVPTLAGILRSEGYATGCFSNNELVGPTRGFTRGFTKVDPLYEREDRPYPWAPETHRRAADWAEEQAAAKKPFFLFINDMEPHQPYAPPQDMQRQFVRGSPTADELSAARKFDFYKSLPYSMRATDLSPREIGLLSDLYDAEIATLDRAIGELFDRLQKDGLLDSAVVVVLGDHGELLGEHHLMEHGYTLHAAARHVPLVVRSKGTFDGGRKVRSLVRVEDVLPTVLELCKVDVPKDLDGVSLAHDLDNRLSIAVQNGNPEGRKRIEADFPGVDGTLFGMGLGAIYDGRFHLVAYADGRQELYDLSADPGERTDLAPGDPANVKRLANLLPPFK